MATEFASLSFNRTTSTSAGSASAIAPPIEPPSDPKLETGARGCLQCLQACRFTSWHGKFHGMHCTLPARTLRLPPEFIEYLNADGLKLPICSGAAPVLPADPRYTRPSDAAAAASRDDDDDSDSWASERAGSPLPRPAGHASDSSDDDEEARPLAPPPSFPTLEDGIHAALTHYGGDLFIKMEWSAPLDAAWTTAAGLRVSSPGQAFLLLKASDLVRFDIDYACAGATDGLHLVLMPWYAIPRSEEFRVFVHASRIVAISQRHATDTYKHLHARIDELRRIIVDFVNAVVKEHFPLSTFAVDVYVSSRGKVYVLDFAPYGGETDMLLLPPQLQVTTCEHAEGGGDKSIEWEAGDDGHIPFCLHAAGDSDDAAAVDMSFAPYARHAFPDDVM